MPLAAHVAPRTKRDSSAVSGGEEVKRPLSPMSNMELAMGTSARAAMDSQKNVDAIMRKNKSLEDGAPVAADTSNFNSNFTVTQRVFSLAPRPASSLRRLVGISCLHDYG